MAAITKAEKTRRKKLLQNGLKWCPRCEKAKPISEFNKNANCKDGLQSYCKECYGSYYLTKRKERLAWQKAYAEEHGDDVVRRNQEYYADHQEELCRRQREYYYTNIEDRKAYYAGYVQTERGKRVRRVCSARRKSRERDLVADFTVEEWSFALIFFDHRCAYCGKSGNLEQEHFIPVALGGGFTALNIIPACHKCNQSKKDKHPNDWMKHSSRIMPSAAKKIEQYFLSLV